MLSVVPVQVEDAEEVGRRHILISQRLGIEAVAEEEEGHRRLRPNAASRLPRRYHRQMILWQSRRHNSQI